MIVFTVFYSATCIGAIIYITALSITSMANRFRLKWGKFIFYPLNYFNLLKCKRIFSKLHFVNWNHRLYKDPKLASESNHNNGLLVLAVFIKVN